MDKKPASQVTIQLPKLGESILSATVVQWLKEPGSRIEKDEALLEVSTDKVNSEIPSPVTGILKEILVQVDEEVEVDAPLAIIEISSDPALEEKKINKSYEQEKTLTLDSVEESSSSFYSPAVLQMIQKAGLSFDEVEKIKGSGACGRVTKKDIELFVERKKTSKALSCSGSFQEKRIRITGLRKTIADAMLRSYQEVPHAALVQEVDVTKLLQYIQIEKEKFLKTYGCKLTLTSFLVRAIKDAAIKYPLLNAWIDGDAIICKQSVNVGIAVGVDQGVIVPVIKQCESKNLSELAKEVAQLAEKARSSQLKHEDVVEGTVTLTNFGMTGTKQGFPIIRQPEVAIVGAGGVQKRVMVTESDAIVIRSMMDLTLCFDHRVVDGIYGCGFINAIKESLEGSLPHSE